MIEQHRDIPFEIKRTYWVYDVPGGEARLGHAYHKNCEFIVALSGSFDVVIYDGEKETVYSLNRSYYGLYVPKRIWRTLTNFSTNSLALLIASEPYDESDYILEIEDYRRLIKNS